MTEVGLGERLEHFPNMLSGGEQQRVTIARSISNNPSILLLDEPTGDLDTKSTDIIMKILVDLNVKHKITMIMVTHDQGLKNFSNRVVKMSDGNSHISISSIKELLTIISQAVLLVKHRSEKESPTKPSKEMPTEKAHQSSPRILLI